MRHYCWKLGLLAAALGAVGGCGSTGNRPGLFSRGTCGGAPGSPCSMSEIPLGPGGPIMDGPYLGEGVPVMPNAPGIPPPPTGGLLPAPQPAIPLVPSQTVPQLQPAPPAQTFPAPPPPGTMSSLPKPTRVTGR